MAKQAYYGDGTKGISFSDFQYDLMEDELRKVDPNHPVLALVGWDDSYLWWIEHYEKESL